PTPSANPTSAMRDAPKSNSSVSHAPNVTKRHWAPPISPNIEIGTSQAREAAGNIAALGVTIDRVVASSLTRASETAGIIAQHLGLASPHIDERLVETDVGPWEGLREQEIEAGWPNYLRDRRTPPNFESPHDVFTRATHALRELAGTGERVLVVSHSGVIRTIRRVLAVHDRRLHNLEGCYFHVSNAGDLLAGEFVSFSSSSRAVTNDAV
ncbi:MAG: histidine phosphatase family protein, partial [Actinomycetota bacterium]